MCWERGEVTDGVPEVQRPEAVCRVGESSLGSGPVRPVWEDCFSLGNGQALKGHDHTTYLFVFPCVTQHGALSK